MFSSSNSRILENISFANNGLYHPDFAIQVGWLDDVFTEGSAYSFGKVNGDCWHLYTMNSDRSHGVQLPDQTFELLMTDLDPEVMKYFYMENCVDGKMATKVILILVVTGSCVFLLDVVQKCL